MWRIHVCSPRSSLPRRESGKRQALRLVFWRQRIMIRKHHSVFAIDFNMEALRRGFTAWLVFSETLAEGDGTGSDLINVLFRTWCLLLLRESVKNTLVSSEIRMCTNEIMRYEKFSLLNMWSFFTNKSPTHYLCWLVFLDLRRPVQKSPPGLIQGDLQNRYLYEPVGCMFSECLLLL